MHRLYLHGLGLIGRHGMKKLLIALLALALTTPAFADRGHGRGWDRGHDWGRGGGWRGDWIFPALIGGAIIYDLARPQPVYVQQPEPVYAPSYAPASVAVPPPVQNWYFCPAANAYYPYVGSCPTGWQTVPATPPLNSAAAAGTTPPPPPSGMPQVISVVPSPGTSGTSSTQQPLPEDEQGE